MMFSRRTTTQPGNETAQGPSVSKSLTDNINKIKTDLGHCSDLVINRTRMDPSLDLEFATLYIKDLTDSSTMNNLSTALTKFMAEYRNTNQNSASDALMRYINGLRASNNSADYKMLYDELLAGNTVFLFEGLAKFFSVSTSSGEGRAITEPTSQTIIKGPKDAFTENIEKNIFLIRKRIKNIALRIENITVGNVTNTQLRLMYINGIAKEDIITDIRNRLNGINYDGILDSGYIADLIKTDPYSVFPTSMDSEKPDSVVAALLEGRIAILVDGTPYVITVPALFTSFIQASEDYYHNFYVSSLVRLIRYVALLLTLYVPAFFIAVTTYHQEIVPTPLLISIASQREGVPFPAFFEVLMMELTFELLREAGIRMPRAIGPSISIVGALVLGQAAVQAGLVSAAVVIVVSVTAISSFAISNYAMSNAIRLLRFVFIFCAGSFGLYGITIGSIIMVLHLCKVKSASVPYLTPIAPYIPGGNKDTILRFPLIKMKYRPTGISAEGTQKTNSNKAVDPNLKNKQELR